MSKPYIAQNCVIKVGGDAVALADKVAVSDEWELKKKFVFGGEIPKITVHMRSTGFSLERLHPENNELLKEKLEAKTPVDVTIYPYGVASGQKIWILRNAIFTSVERDLENPEFAVESCEGNAEFLALGLYDPNLVLYLPFDYDCYGRAEDLSGLGNHGTVLNNPPYIPGKYGLCLDLNGSSQAVNVPNNASLNPTTALTVACWIRPSVTAQTYRRIMMKGIIDNYSWILGYSSTEAGKVRFTVYTSATYTATSTTQLQANQWYHVAGVYDGTKVYIYINGTPESSVDATGSIRTNTNSLGIGYQPDGMYYLQADIDEAFMFNNAKSQAYIQKLMALHG